MPKTPRSVVKPPSEYELETARELRTKQKIMRSIISEVCWYIAYLILISIVAYGNRDPKAYYVTRTMNDLFVENKYSARLRLNDVSNGHFMFGNIVAFVNNGVHTVPSHFILYHTRIKNLNFRSKFYGCTKIK